MRRLFAIAIFVGLAVLLFMATVAGADDEVRYFAYVSVQLLAVILGVVLVSSIFTVVYLMIFGGLCRRWVENHFSVFVGWTLLRSHRVIPTMRASISTAWVGIVHRPWRSVGLWIGLGIVVLAGTMAFVGRPTSRNLITAAFSPGFAMVLEIELFFLGAILLLGGLLGAAFRWTKDTVDHARKMRTAVTLPTFISIVGVSIGIWALVVVLSVMHGFESDLRDNILRTNAHIMLEPVEASGVLGEAIRLEDTLSRIPNVVEVNAYAYGEVMMASSTNIAVNVMVKGMSESAFMGSEQLKGRVSPGDARWLNEPEKMLSDRFRYPLHLELADPTTHAPFEKPTTLTPPPTEVFPGILLGVELALSLNVEVGSEVRLISPDGDVGPTGLRPKLRIFRVAGVFTTGMYEYDQKLAYLTVEDAQSFFGLGYDLNRVEIRLADSRSTTEVLQTVNPILAKDFPGLQARDWKTRNKSLFSALQLERIVMFIVLGFIILVASLLIVSSLVMLIVEKSRDIAILKALGASSRSIVRVFLIIGGVIGTIGGASGITLGLATCLAIKHLGVPLPKEYYISNLPIDLDPLEVSLVTFVALVICLLATLYPSIEASSLRPVEGIRHGR